MEAKEIDPHSYWKKINAIHRVLRGLDRKDKVGYTIALENAKNNIIDYSRKNQISPHDLQDLVTFIDKLILDGSKEVTFTFTEDNYDFDDILFNDSKIDSVIIDESKKVQKILLDIYRDNSTLLTLNNSRLEECTRIKKIRKS